MEIGLSFKTSFDKTDEKYKKYFHTLHSACCYKYSSSFDVFRNFVYSNSRRAIIVYEVINLDKSSNILETFLLRVSLRLNK